jgi:hypothetical protein
MPRTTWRNRDSRRFCPSTCHVIRGFADLDFLSPSQPTLAKLGPFDALRQITREAILHLTNGPIPMPSDKAQRPQAPDFRADRMAPRIRSRLSTREVPQMWGLRGGEQPWQHQGAIFPSPWAQGGRALRIRVFAATPPLLNGPHRPDEIVEEVAWRPGGAGLMRPLQDRGPRRVELRPERLTQLGQPPSIDGVCAALIEVSDAGRRVDPVDLVRLAWPEGAADHVASVEVESDRDDRATVERLGQGAGCTQDPW